MYIVCSQLIAYNDDMFDMFTFGTRLPWPIHVRTEWLHIFGGPKRGRNTMLVLFSPSKWTPTTLV